MRKTLQTVAMSLIVISLIGCGSEASKGAGESEKIKKSQNHIVNASNKEELEKFYLDYATKLENIIEKDDKYYITTLYGDAINVNKVKSKSEKFKACMIADLDVSEGEAIFSMYSYPEEEDNTGETNNDLISMVNEYFGYGLNIEDVKKELNEKKEFNVNDKASFYIGANNGVSFSGEVVANVGNVDMGDPKPSLTLEESTQYNILKSGKADKILDKFGKSRSDFEEIDEIEPLESFKIPLSEDETDFTYEHKFSLSEGKEDFYSDDIIEIRVLNENDTIESKMETQLKPLLEIIYGDTKIYDEINKRISEVPLTSETFEHLKFTPNILGFNIVSLYKRKLPYGGIKYEIRIRNNQMIK